MSINYLDKTGLAYLWGKIKARFVEKDGSKGLSTNDYTTAEKTKLSGIEAGANNYTLPAASSSVLGGVKVGVANGVAPLNAYGVIPGEYIPGGGEEDRYVVNVNVNTYLVEPQADPDELKEIAEHNAPELRLVLNDSVYFHASLLGKTMHVYMFSVLNANHYVQYAVNTISGTISVAADGHFATVTEEE